MTSDIEPIQPEPEQEEIIRSYQYTEILTELRHWRGGAYNISKRLYDQGKKEGLPDDLIRRRGNFKTTY